MLGTVQVPEIPGPRPDVHGPPSPAGFGISRVLGSVGSLRHTANRARWSISLHYRIASLQAVDRVDWCGTCCARRRRVAAGMVRSVVALGPPTRNLLLRLGGVCHRPTASEAGCATRCGCAPGAG